MAYFEGCKTLKELKGRYKKLSLELHPDRNNGRCRRFLRMKEEYELYLSDILETENLKKNLSDDIADWEGNNMEFIRLFGNDCVNKLLQNPEQYLNKNFLKTP